MKNVLITRQAEQSVEFINLLSKNGFYPFILSLIQTLPVEFETEYNKYDFIVFPSVNAVKYFFQNKNKICFNHIVSVGSKTAEYLKNLGFTSDYVPDKFSAEGLAKLFENVKIKHKTFLLPGPEKRKDEFYKFLLSKNCYAEIITVYKTLSVKYETGYIEKFIDENKVDIVTFASPSAAKSFFYQIRDIKRELKFVSIGTTTYNYLKTLGIDSIYPNEFTAAGMVELIKEKFGN